MSGELSRACVLMPLGRFAGNKIDYNQQPTTNNQQPTTNNQQPTTNNQQPTTNTQQPTPNNHQPTTNNQQPTTNNQHSPFITDHSRPLLLPQRVGVCFGAFQHAGVFLSDRSHHTVHGRAPAEQFDLDRKSVV